MSRRWLLSLLCLSVLLLSLVPLTHADGEVKVDESRTRILIQTDPIEIQLAVANSTGKTLSAAVQLELLDPRDRIAATSSTTQQITPGDQTLKLSLPFSISKLRDNERREILWYRLRYRLSEQSPLAEGIVSLSQSPDLFELRVVTSELAREGRTYHVRVNASHPLTHKPAAKVVITGEFLLEDDANRSVKLQATKTTDSEGYTLLDFKIPPRFPQFPHTLQPAGGEVKLVGRRGAVVAEVTGDVVVDQFARTLITPDKPIYQPGQTMHVRALLFTPSRRALAKQNIEIRISDPEDVTVFRSVVTSSRFGIATADWPIPQNTRLGDYRIWVGVEGEEQYAHTPYDVRISRYDLPNFSVSVEPDRGYYLPAQNAVVRVRADYLFGKPVARGHVRVVRESERQWNYREQKWDVEEGDKYEGETDASGVFVAHVDLAEEHQDLEDSHYEQFKDLNYAAYFTDSTTNRTEERRFDLRVTKNPIHIYVIDNYAFWQHNRTLPLTFYVSTFYADGSPAQCRVNLALAERTPSDTKDRKRVATFRTNRYGLAKAADIRLPPELKALGTVYLTATAVDANGRKGTEDDHISLSDDPEIQVKTEKAIYAAGEPINAVITSNVRDQTIFVDVAQNDVVIRTERVEMRNGRALVSFPYRSDFQNQLSIAAYTHATDSEKAIDTWNVLYPQNLELKVKAQPSQASYRPGEDVQIHLSVQAPRAQTPESALGVMVIDKAVDERFRSNQESNQRTSTLNDSLQHFLGLDEQIAGVSMRDLQRLDGGRFIAPDLQLLAEVLLSRQHQYSPRFHGGDEYATDVVSVFSELVNQQIKPVHDALNARYLRAGEYPRTEIELRAILSDAGIDFAKLHDPWGNNYRADFSVSGASDMLTLMTAGADERFDTEDDFSVDRSSWRYFVPVGGAIERVVRAYHKRTGGFILDEKILLAELLQRQNISLDQLKDRWGQPYHLDFGIVESNYVLSVSSGGPDKKFSIDGRDSGDDFIIWAVSMDYFAEQRARLQAAVKKHVEATKTFPRNDAELREALRAAGEPLDSLRDPWGRPYYTTFKTQQFYADRASIENRATYGQSATQQVKLTPVTRTAGSIAVRSVGPDGREGTLDDFSVASFTSPISEQTRESPQPQAVAPVVFNSEKNGAIKGTVSDVNGARVATATMTAKRAGDDKKYQATTNEEGAYVLADLPPGLYEVRIEAPGFYAAVITDVAVGEWNVIEVNATLRVAAAVETVTVTSEANKILTQSSTGVGNTFDRRIRLVAKSGASQLSTPRLREYFPETLLWQPAVETDKQGRAQLNFKLADNITTWKLAVIGSTEDGRIGSTETDIKAFQPFFVEHDPPRVLTQGDEISLPVVVRNYLERQQKVELEIKPENWFALLGPARKQASVPAGDASRTTFDFRATASVEDGKQRVTASGSDANDAIEKPITVHPDGEELITTAGDILGSSATLDLNLPETMIADSKRAEVKIYPNLMAHVIESVEAIMARPYGCAEQSISATYPSLMLLRNYKQNGADFRYRTRAERYLNDGYSRLLNYREDEGGFGYWGRGEPDVAVTAYALRFLMDASTVIAVDEGVIDGARDWLLKRQRPDGSWAAHEYWNGPEIKRRSALLTAYVTHVLAINANRKPADKELGAALVAAFDYLQARAAEIDEPYLIASYALASLEIKDTATAKTLVEKLRLLVHAEGSAAYWALETHTPFYGWGLAGRVETTALVVQALARYCASQSATCEDEQKLINRGLVFLLKQKDSYGVWYSTQATINVLNALLALLANNHGEARESAAEIVVNGRTMETVTIPASRELASPIAVDLSKYLAAGKNRVEIKRPASGPFASVQAVANYYVPWANAAEPKGDLRLLAKFDKIESNANDEITCHVEAERVGFRGYGMMLAEIGLPPGADVDRSSLETAMTASGWSMTQYDILPDRVVVYLWPRAGGVKFDFKFRPRFGLKAKTAASVIYDYYNPESRTVLAPSVFKIR